MAENIWLGTTTDWDTGANWSLGAAPVDTNTVVFNGNNVTDLLLNVDNGAIDLAGLHIMESYTGTIGAADAPLEIEVSGELLIEGTGSYYIQSAAVNATTDGSIDRTVVNTSRGLVFLSSMNNDGSNDTDFTVLIVNAGTVTIYGDADKATTGAEAGTVIGTLSIYGGAVTNGDLNYKVNGTVYTDIVVEGGTLDNHSSMGTIDMFGGKVNVGTIAYTMSSFDTFIVALNLYSGKFTWQPSIVTTPGDSGVRTTGAPIPIISTVNVYGGEFNAADMLEKFSSAPTITTATLYDQSRFNLDNKYAQFVVTTLKDLGGSIIKSSGQSLTLS